MTFATSPRISTTISQTALVASFEDFDFDELEVPSKTPQYSQGLLTGDCAIGPARLPSIEAGVGQRIYTGHEYDGDTALNYMGQRYQSGKYGKFLSQDPVFRAVGDSQAIGSLINISQSKYLEDPQQLNSYAYARNNPLKLVDPNGLFSLLTGTVEKGDTLGFITNVLNNTYSTNYSVSTIAKLNGIQNPNLIRTGQMIVPNMSYPDVSKSLVDTAKQNAQDSSINSKPAGPLNFYNKVKPGGDWDFKNDPKSQFYVGKKGEENYKPFFVFEGKIVRNDFPGNFNYGYTGASTWWGNSDFLLGAAGGAQVLSNIGRWQAPSWNSSYFDNPGDSQQILQGINYGR